MSFPFASLLSPAYQATHLNFHIAIACSINRAMQSNFLISPSNDDDDDDDDDNDDRFSLLALRPIRAERCVSEEINAIALHNSQRWRFASWNVVGYFSFHQENFSPYSPYYCSD